MTVVCFMLFTNIMFSQAKDVSRLSEKEKKEELIETLNWLQSKIGNGMQFRHMNNYYYYYDLIYDAKEPHKLKLRKVKIEPKMIIETISFDLEKIYRMVVFDRRFISIETYEKQRFIYREKNGQSFLESSILISYDSHVSKERMSKALNYILKLTDGGKQIIYEKF